MSHPTPPSPSAVPPPDRDGVGPPAAAARPLVGGAPERRGGQARARSRGTGEDLRTAILDEARRVITGQGVAALSTRRVAEAVGCTATSIYLYFHSKDALLHAVIDEGMQALHARLVAACESAAQPSERLTALARAYVDFGLEHPTLYEVMFLLHPRHMERYPADAYRRARRNVELVAETLAAAHGGPPDLARASTVFALLHGHVALWLAGRIDASLPRETFFQGAFALVERVGATTHA